MNDKPIASSTLTGLNMEQQNVTGSHGEEKPKINENRHLDVEDMPDNKLRESSQLSSGTPGPNEQTTQSASQQGPPEAGNIQSNESQSNHTSSTATSPHERNEIVVTGEGTKLRSWTKQQQLAILLAILCFPLAIITFFYIYVALVSHNASLSHLIPSPTKTLAIISVLSQTLTLLVRFFSDSVFEVLHWRLAARPEGVSVATFIALSGATSILGF